METRTLTFTTLVAVLAALLTFSGSGFAARKVCDDGTFPPCADSGSGTEPPDFGDLIILYRDEDGVPNLTSLDGPQVADRCQQPLPSDACVAALPVDCELAPGEPDPNVLVVPVDPATCGVVAACATCTEEVDFGRINVARAPVSVFEAQLADVIVNLATADCRTLDPAGRLVANRVVVNSDTGLDEVLTSTIDSPLQNLAIYRQLMLTGTLGAPLPEGAGTLDTAARGLGVSSDKSGEVNVDVVAYLNHIMGLSDLGTPTILDPKICIDVREEVQGVVDLVNKCFLDYGNVPQDGTPYDYDRSANFLGLPSPPYIDDPAGGVDDMPGWFEYLTLYVDDPIYPQFIKAYGPILDAVFGTDPVTGSNIGGFAQAADDTRAVINYMHQWQVPVDYVTPVPCETDPDLIAYDVSISEESGLQVPKNIVDGSEGREFVVTVANASGSADPATGTVTVTAIPDVGGPIAGSPWVFEFEDLAPDTSQSWTTFFTVDIGQRTTINWTAIAAAPNDVNPANNTVTAVSNVKVTGSGSGGGNGGQ